MSRPQDDRNQEATVYLVCLGFARMPTKVLTSAQGNLDERITDALIWELMLQAGPVGEYRYFSFIHSVTGHLSAMLSQCPLAQRPHFYGTPRVRVLRVLDRGGRRICL